jgi:hypothetical protein
MRLFFWMRQVAFGSKTEPDYNLDQLINLYFQKTVLAYAVFFLVYVAGMLGVLGWLTRRQSRAPSALRAHAQLVERFRSFAYPSIAGLFGSSSVLFAKSVGKLVQSSIVGQEGASDQWTRGETYVLLLALLVSLVLQTLFLNAGLAHPDGTMLYVVPIYIAFWVVSSCAVGMVRFQPCLAFVFGSIATRCCVLMIWAALLW